MREVHSLFGRGALGLLMLAACSHGGGGNDGGGDGGGFLDICTSPTTALTEPGCEIDLSQSNGDGGYQGPGQQFYIGTVGEHVWLWLDLPATLPPRPLLQLTAGYDAPSSPVDLSLNLITSDQKTGLASGVNDHGAAAPEPIDLLLTPPDAGAQLLLDCSDDGNAHADVYNPFTVWAALITDPDVNDPSNPTPVTLSGGSGVQTGSCPQGPCQGVLSVAGRVDAFSVQVPSSVTRPILYLSVSAPTDLLAPPPAYDMSYQVKDSTGTVIYADHVENAFQSLDTSDGGVSPLSAALLVQSNQTYTIDVLGYEPSGTGTPASGDVRLTYTLNVNVMPDVDVNEPNDTLPQATPVSFGSVGAEQKLTGRLGYIGDDDWYALQFPANSGPTRLSYTISPTKNGGRYPPILGTAVDPLPFPDRVSQISFLVPNSQGGAQACQSDTNICPEDPQIESNPIVQQLQATLCTDADGNSDAGGLCLVSARDETSATEQSFPPLQNFQGIFPIPTAGGPQTYYLDYKSLGGAYCDDLDYTIDLVWETDPNGANQTVATATPEALPDGNGSFPNPPGGGVSGAITVGYGYLSQFDLTNVWYPGDDVRAPNDYDAVPSSTDFFAFSYPAGYSAASDPNGATWELSWSVAANAPETLIVQVIFCEEGQTGACVQMTGPRGAGGLPGALTFSANDDLPWYDPNGSIFPNNAEAPTFSQSGSTVTVQPNACFCFEPEFFAFGKFYLAVTGADRTAWTDTNYTVTTGIASYPKSFSIAGTSYSCPTPGFPTGNDGGCGMVTGGG